MCDSLKKKISKNGKLYISTFFFLWDWALNVECMVLCQWMFEKTLLPAAGLHSPKLAWRAAVKIRKLHPSAAVCIGVHTVLCLGLLPLGFRQRRENSRLFPPIISQRKRVLLAAPACAEVGSRMPDCIALAQPSSEGNENWGSLGDLPEMNGLRVAVVRRAVPNGILLQRAPTICETMCPLPQLLKVAKLLPRRSVQLMQILIKPLYSVQKHNQGFHFCARCCCPSWVLISVTPRLFSHTERYGEHWRHTPVIIRGDGPRQASSLVALGLGKEEQLKFGEIQNPSSTPFTHTKKYYMVAPPLDHYMAKARRKEKLPSTLRGLRSGQNCLRDAKKRETETGFTD